MEVTVVDSEPAVTALTDFLDRLPNEPPSLYLDIEGVKLSRHGSISIIQLFVLPRNHIFLIDVFLLKEAAFCTSNSSGTSLRSILESAQVPKVFFDVRNDSDALFAHFQISLQGVHDVQLLEVAARSFSRNRISGLGGCIEKDARLTSKALAVWKATKQKGLLHFAPEHGGSYEVFNSRPMLQDIIDYCTQDVVYLPLLWKIYTKKISAKWMRKVQHETRERIVASQEASYEPNGRKKTLSPWAKPAKTGQEDRPANTGARSPATAVAQVAATEAAKKTAVPQPVSRSESQPAVGQAEPRRSARLAALEAAKPTPQISVELERPVPELHLPIRSKAELNGGPRKKTALTLPHTTVHSKWNCTTCGREMLEDQKEAHIAGKQHIERVKRAAKDKPPGMKTAVTENPQKRSFPKKAKPLQTHPGPATATATGIKSRKRHAAVPISQQVGLPYPPDHLFSGFQESRFSRTGWDETSWPLDDVDHSLCDKDCGWCGHCCV